MIGSLISQNKHLSNAAKTPKDTSHRTEKAKKYSAEITSAQKPSQTVQGSKDVVTKSTRGSNPKGSMEGLIHGASTVLQFNDSGYARKSAQGARYSQGPQRVAGIQSSSFTSDKRYSIMDNYSSMTADKSSSDRLSAIIRNNSYF